MKYARFEHRDEEHYGIVEGEALLELDGSILGDHEQTGIRYDLAAVKLLPPVVPGKIVCIGQNYLGHIEEIGATPPQKPLFFLKPPSSLVGPSGDIIYPRTAVRVDYEGELAVVIKKKMKEVPEVEAKEYVLGYSCFNDVTERALVANDPFNLTLAKSFDTFSAFGPYIVTDIDPDNVRLKTYLNGELKQDDNTRNCVFGVPQILHYLSKCLTLYPGDIVTTGTPKGIAPMNPGDLVEVEIEGIGKLSNGVKAAK
ncbi:MAG: fumarylacetoacetate hydrolase family protein [Desulfobacterales bacterium]|nr:MAG: fumarylacetoacetate hydrolase family protein [Desulfobacterales bacterium]